ncbi:MAG: nucleotidyltransferase family protein [Candidatus Krumholzibacteria bacterium]|jgi:dTDP-glucose pyrophosphorylase/CBS domain-containing protein|nr:nucleotidyltransferase family protein [Candidatus Krumholzibacteria bacterium]
MSARKPALDGLIVAPETPIVDALQRLEQAGTGGLAICDGERRLLAFLTDGDIRRALLSATPLSSPCGAIARPDPVTIMQPVSPEAALLLMTKYDINHLPVVDAAGRLQDILRRQDLVAEAEPGIRALSRLELASVPPALPLGEAISRLDLAGTGALLLCDEQGGLLGLLTDGDVRRAVIRGVSMSTACLDIASREPLTMRPPAAAADALHLMNTRDINHLPVVDAGGKVVDFLLRKDLISEQTLGLAAVIMAGGFGKRLLPLTERVPKPMLPLGGRPLLERTIQRLQQAGITDVHLTTYHQADMISDHFGDGRAFGVDLKYTREDQPLGTAGGLKLVAQTGGPILVLNGDILTDMSFDGLLAFHREHKADLTVGVRKYEITVPFGVVECSDVRVRQLREKPTETLFINAGVYLLEPSVLALIPDGVRFDMTDLIQALLAEDRRVISFPILEYWLDIGRPEDYRQAQDDMRDGRTA